MRCTPDVESPSARPSRPGGQPGFRAEPSLAGVLAARCHQALLAIEEQGGPDVASHLRLLGRALLRSPARSRSGRGAHRDRARVERALTAITGVGDRTATGVDPACDRQLLADLRRLARVLGHAARIGGRDGAAVAPPGTAPVRPRASHRATG